MQFLKSFVAKDGHSKETITGCCWYWVDSWLQLPSELEASLVQPATNLVFVMQIYFYFYVIFLYISIKIDIWKHRSPKLDDQLGLCGCDCRKKLIVSFLLLWRHLCSNVDWEIWIGNHRNCSCGRPLIFEFETVPTRHDRCHDRNPFGPGNLEPNWTSIPARSY